MERTQTGVRMATPLLKLLKALAAHKEMSLGDLLEGIVLHAFEGKTPFSADTLRVVEKLKEAFDCRLTSADSHLHPDRDKT